MLSTFSRLCSSDMFSNFKVPTFYRLINFTLLEKNRVSGGFVMHFADILFYSSCSLSSHCYLLVYPDIASVA